MQNHKRLQLAFRDHIVAQNPQMMITFNYDRQVSFDQMQAHVADFTNRMQRFVLGRGWMTKDPTHRPCLIGVAEHLDANSHVHAALIAPEAFIDFAASQEAKSSPSARTFATVTRRSIQRVQTSSDGTRHGDYGQILLAAARRWGQERGRCDPGGAAVLYRRAQKGRVGARLDAHLTIRCRMSRHFHCHLSSNLYHAKAAGAALAFRWRRPSASERSHMGDATRRVACRNSSCNHRRPRAGAGGRHTR